MCITTVYVIHLFIYIPTVHLIHLPTYVHSYCICKPPIYLYTYCVSNPPIYPSVCLPVYLLLPNYVLWPQEGLMHHLLVTVPRCILSTTNRTQHFYDTLSLSQLTDMSASVRTSTPASKKDRMLHVTGKVVFRAYFKTYVNIRSLKNSRYKI
jgi:hypothetical protein